MAMQQLGGPITMDGTAKSLADWLSYTDKRHAMRIGIFKAKINNAAPIYFGKDATVTSAGANAIGYLTASATAGEGMVIDFLGSPYPETIYVVGTANDVLYVWLVE